MKRCPGCKTTKDESFFFVDRSKKDGLTSWCKPCRTIAKRQYYWEDPGKYLERRKRYRANAPPKDKFKEVARRRTYYLVLRGRLRKPEECQDCGNKVKLQAHHHDYTKPEDVRWLCAPCHGIEHRKYK